MTTEPHIHRIPNYSGIGGFVLFTFGTDVDENHAFVHSRSHSALIYDSSWFESITNVDLRGQQYGAIITHIYGSDTIHPVYDLMVISSFGTLFLVGVAHKDEPINLAYCAVPCLNAASESCAFPKFCIPDPTTSLPCPTTNNSTCRWQQLKVGRWEELPEQFTTGLPI